MNKNSIITGLLLVVVFAMGFAFVQTKSSLQEAAVVNTKGVTSSNNGVGLKGSSTPVLAFDFNDSQLQQVESLVKSGKFSISQLIPIIKLIPTTGSTERDLYSCRIWIPGYWYNNTWYPGYWTIEFRFSSTASSGCTLLQSNV